MKTKISIFNKLIFQYLMIITIISSTIPLLILGIAVYVGESNTINTISTNSVSKVQSTIEDLKSSLSHSIDEISHSIEKVSTVAEETATGSEEANAATEQQSARI